MQTRGADNGSRPIVSMLNFDVGESVEITCESIKDDE